jgi:hypothetical protein
MQDSFQACSFAAHPSETISTKLCRKGVQAWLHATGALKGYAQVVLSSNRMGRANANLDILPGPISGLRRAAARLPGIRTRFGIHA